MRGFSPSRRGARALSALAVAAAVFGIATAVRADVHDGELGRRIQDAIEPIVERVFQIVCSIDGRYPDAPADSLSSVVDL